MAVAQAVAHQTEDVSAALGVVAGTMGAIGIPLETCHCKGLAEHGLPERSTGERRRVEAGKGVKGIALDVGARHGGVEEPEVEGGVVAYEDGTAAVIGAHGMADLAKYALQRIALGQCRPQRVEGIDPGYRQRRRIEPRTLERLDVEV